MNKKVSQKTIVALMHALQEYMPPRTSWDSSSPDYTQLLYERGFPDWFVNYAGSNWYSWNWQKILTTMRNGNFFFIPNTHMRKSITGHPLSPSDARKLGERLIERLAAFGTTLPTGNALLRSLQLDGFEVNRAKLALVPSRDG